MLLLLIGGALFFWRQRRANRHVDHGDDTTGDDVIHHGKPELAGSQATNNSSWPIVEKSELDTSAHATGSPLGSHSGSNNHVTTSEMFQQPNELANTTRPAELGQHMPLSTGKPTYDGGERDAASSQRQAYPEYAELPATMSRNASTMRPSKLTDVTASQASPAKRPPVSPASQPSRSQRAISDCDASSSKSHGNSYGAHEYNYNSINADEDISALRQRERELAESISAAENLARLKSEQRELQERIRRAEEADWMAGRGS